MQSKNLSNTNSKPIYKYTPILIIGKGYIGNYLYDHLCVSGFTHTTLVASKDLNYHDIRTLRRHILDAEIRVIINCSGFTGRPNIDEAETKKPECWELNVASPLRIAELCNDIGVKYIHISSGCIYDGYEKNFTEKDTPNFGLFDDSSFYSTTKHAFETLTNHLPVKIIRIRMPFSPDLSNRNYLTKIKGYDKLINYRNSKTYIPDLCEFTEKLLLHPSILVSSNEVYNVVNSGPLNTQELVEILKQYGFENKNWTLVDMKDIPIIAPRSNCVLDGSKANKIHQMKTEKEALKAALL